MYVSSNKSIRKWSVCIFHYNQNLEWSMFLPTYCKKLKFSHFHAYCFFSFFPIVLISGLGLGDAIFYSKPMKLFNIEIPKSLVYILFCHLVLLVVCWIVYAKLCIGQWTLTKVIWMLSFIITLITIGSDVKHLRVFSFILLYVRWTILQLELPNMVPVNVRGFIFCLGKSLITKKYLVIHFGTSRSTFIHVK